MSQAQVVGKTVRAGQRLADTAVPLRIEKPFGPSRRYQLAYPVLSVYYRTMARLPKLGRLLLAQNKREQAVMRFAGSSTALDALYGYPGFLGALRENHGNPWPAFWSWLNENCQNARDVRYRTWIAVDLFEQMMLGGACRIVDLAAGSSLATWEAISRTGYNGQVVLIDFAIHSVYNQHLAARTSGLSGKIPIEPALVLDQVSLQNGNLKRILAKAEDLRKKLNQELGLDLTLEQFVDPRPVLAGTLAQRIRPGARVVPVVGDAQNLLPFLQDGFRFGGGGIFGFLDYLEPAETVRDLAQARQLLEPGAILAAALMAPNAEISEDPAEPSFVRRVPWYYAETKMGLVLKPKSSAVFVRMVQEAGFRVRRVLATPSDVYNVIVAEA